MIVPSSIVSPQFGRARSGCANSTWVYSLVRSFTIGSTIVSFSLQFGRSRPRHGAWKCVCNVGRKMLAAMRSFSFFNFGLATALRLEIIRSLLRLVIVLLRCVLSLARCVCRPVSFCAQTHQRTTMNLPTFFALRCDHRALYHTCLIHSTGTKKRRLQCCSVAHRP
jgi:hypothetical protein